MVKMKKKTWKVFAGFFVAVFLLGSFLEVRAADVNFSFQLSETNPVEVICNRKCENATASYIRFNSIGGSSDLRFIVWISDQNGNRLTESLEVASDDIHKMIALPYRQEYLPVIGQYVCLNIKVIGKYARVQGVWVQ